MATIYEVAKLAGVSLATVSRVINGNAKVSDKNRTKVTEAITKLDYRPNTAAKSLATNRTNSIGLMVSELYGPFYGQMMSQVETTLRSAGKHVIITAGHSEESSEREGIQFLINRNCDGLILHAEAMQEKELVTLSQSGKPVVLLNREISLTQDQCIHMDNEMGGRLVADYLLDQGHRNIAYITGPLWKTDASRRLNGAINACARKGFTLPASLVVEGDYSEESGHQAMAGLLAQNVDITAVICGNDAIAAGAMRAVREADLNIPSDISVVGFDNTQFSRFCYPALTTVHHPIAEMGKMAAELILHRIYGLPLNSATFLFHPRLIIRDSVRKV